MIDFYFNLQQAMSLIVSMSDMISINGVSFTVLVRYIVGAILGVLLFNQFYRSLLHYVGGVGYYAAGALDDSLSVPRSSSSGSPGRSMSIRDYDYYRGAREREELLR